MMALVIGLVGGYVGLAALVGWLLGVVPFRDESDRGPACIIFSLFAPIGILVAIGLVCLNASKQRSEIKGNDARRREELREAEHKITLASLREQEQEVRRLA